MDQREKDFLLAEFTIAWDQISRIDDRRLRFIQYYSTIFVGVLSILSITVFTTPTPSVLTVLGATLVLIMTILVGRNFKQVLKSEREGNLRNRRKVNHIREIFLGNSNDELINQYLHHKNDYGVKLIEDNASLDDIGSTLTKVFRFFTYGNFIIAVFMAVVWVKYILQLLGH